MGPMSHAARERGLSGTRFVPMYASFQQNQAEDASLPYCIDISRRRMPRGRVKRPHPPRIENMPGNIPCSSHRWRIRRRLARDRSRFQQKS